jgi:hypothetical protein
MKRRLPVPLVPGERGGYLLDAELPPLSREELDRILDLIGGTNGGAAGSFGASDTTDTCEECQPCKECKECEDEPEYSACTA